MNWKIIAVMGFSLVIFMALIPARMETEEKDSYWREFADKVEAEGGIMNDAKGETLYFPALNADQYKTSGIVAYFGGYLDDITAYALDTSALNSGMGSIQVGWSIGTKTGTPLLTVQRGIFFLEGWADVVNNLPTTTTSYVDTNLGVGLLDNRAYLHQAKPNDGTYKSYTFTYAKDRSAPGTPTMTANANNAMNRIDLNFFSQPNTSSDFYGQYAETDINLVAFYDFEDNNTLTQATFNSAALDSNIVFDSNNYAHNLVMTNSPVNTVNATRTSGFRGMGMHLKGNSGSKAYTPDFNGGNAFNFDTTDDFSVCAWIWASPMNQYRIIASDLGKTNTGDTKGWTFYLSSIASLPILGLQLVGSNANGQLLDVNSVLYSIPSNRWSHVCFAYNGSSGANSGNAAAVTLYRNGEVIANNTTVLDTLTTQSIKLSSDANFAIGYWPDPTGFGWNGFFSFDGNIDQVAVYREAINGWKEYNLFESGKGRFAAFRKTSGDVNFTPVDGALSDFESGTAPRWGNGSAGQASSGTLEVVTTPVSNGTYSYHVGGTGAANGNVYYILPNPIMRGMLHLKMRAGEIATTPRHGVNLLGSTGQSIVWVTMYEDGKWKWSPNGGTTVYDVNTNSTGAKTYNANQWYDVKIMFDTNSNYVRRAGMTNYDMNAIPATQSRLYVDNVLYEDDIRITASENVKDIKLFCNGIGSNCYYDDINIMALHSESRLVDTNVTDITAPTATSISDVTTVNSHQLTVNYNATTDNGTDYYYVVKSIDETGNYSDPSPQQTATLTSDLKQYLVNCVSGGSCTAGANDSGGVDGVVASPTTTFSVSGLAQSTQYCFTIVATDNKDNNSAASAQLCGVTTTCQDYSLNSDWAVNDECNYKNITINIGTGKLYIGGSGLVGLDNAFILTNAVIYKNGIQPIKVRKLNGGNINYKK